MKNNLIFTFALLLAAFTLNAQSYKKYSPDFVQGRVDFQVAIGLTPTFIGGTGTMTSPPIAANLEVMVNKRLSIGAYGAHSVTETKEKIFVDGLVGAWKNTHTEAGIRLGIHFTDIPKFDFYGGPHIGIRHNKVEDMMPGMEQLNIYKGIEPVKTRGAFGGFVGARYAAKEKITAFAEIGTGASLVRVGAGFRLFKGKKS